jgi:hypothetical protein
MTLPETFWEKVHKTDACWLWLGATTPKGYARYRNGYAHRYVHEEFIGPIPAGFHIDHVKDRGCTHRNCVNPAHLEAVTMQENLRRGRRNNGQADKTHCKWGHPFDERNTHHTKKQRVCRMCAKLRARTYRKAATA